MERTMAKVQRLFPVVVLCGVIGLVESSNAQLLGGGVGGMAGGGFGGMGGFNSPMMGGSHSVGGAAGGGFGSGFGTGINGPRGLNGGVSGGAAAQGGGALNSRIERNTAPSNGSTAPARPSALAGGA